MVTEFSSGRMVPGTKATGLITKRMVKAHFTTWMAIFSKGHGKKTKPTVLASISIQTELVMKENG